MWVEHRNGTRTLLLLLLSDALCGSWEVKYHQKRICAVKGSTAVILCSFYYPHNHTVCHVMWGHDSSDAFSGPFIFDSNVVTTSSKFQYIGNKQHNCSFEIHQVAHNDSGEYTFRFAINTKHGKWTGKADPPRLKVVDLNISVTKHNGSATTKEGDAVNLTCTNDCDGGNLSSVFTWFKNGELINEGPVLHLSNVSSVNSGNYTCSLKRHKGTTSGVINVDVEYSPKNTSVSVSPSMEVDADINFTLFCSSHANPPVVNYTWFKITNDVSTIVGQRPEFISNDGGQYLCRASNKHGSQNSSVVTLNVKERWKAFDVFIISTVAVLLVVAAVIAVRIIIREGARAPEAECEGDMQNTEYVNWPLTISNNQSQVSQCEGAPGEVTYATIVLHSKRKSNTEQQTDPDDSHMTMIYSTVCRSQPLNSSYIEPSRFDNHHVISQ